MKVVTLILIAFSLLLILYLLNVRVCVEHGAEKNTVTVHPSPSPLNNSAGPIDSTPLNNSTGQIDSTPLNNVSPLNVPIPMGALKETSERYNARLWRTGEVNQAWSPDGSYPTPYSFAGVNGPIYQAPVQNDPRFAFASQSRFPSMPGANVTNSKFQPYGPNERLNLPFIGSVNAYAPFPEVDTPWEKAGILTPLDSSESLILNLYRRPIAPLQDLWEYNAQDKNGFLIQLRAHRFIEDGDTIQHIDGYEKYGPFKARVYVQNKYIWV